MSLSTLQRIISLTLAASAAALFAVAVHAGSGPLALVGVLVATPLCYALALAIEFICMHRVNRRDPAPRASWLQVGQAWLAEVASGPRVFGWRQPWRAERWPDALGDGVHPSRPVALVDQAVRSSNGVPPPAPEVGVLLVHGFFCNRGLWNPWLARLTAERVPFVAVDLVPVFGSIDDYAGRIEAGVCRLEAVTGRPPVVVAHSMGGLALRRWWAEPGNADRVAHAITLGTPHHGTWLARLAFSANGRQMRPDGAWLRELAAAEQRAGRPWRGRITCFYSHCDNIVFPATTATLPGEDNRHLEAVAHVDMADRSEPYRALRDVLDRLPKGPDTRFDASHRAQAHCDCASDVRGTASR